MMRLLVWLGILVCVLIILLAQAYTPQAVTGQGDPYPGPTPRATPTNIPYPEPGWVQDVLYFPIIFNADPATAAAPFLIRHIPTGNAFLDYNLTAVFTRNDGLTHRVAGYYDGGGEWRVMFNEAGTWEYALSLRHGQNIAVLEDATAVTLVEADGHVVIGGESVSRLVSGGAYLDWGGAWIKTGVNSPENFLAQDFVAHGGRAGAMDYLASQHINSVYMLLLNIGGDGDDVWPYSDRNSKLLFDTHKMKEWQSLFAHANEKGIALHLVLAETETSNYLDNGQLGIERKLFYREMVARFGHLPAIVWNISEESNYTAVQFNEFAAYIRELDWANHPITFHTYHNNPGQYAGSSPDLFSIQYSPDKASEYVEMLRPFNPVGMDEQSTHHLNDEAMLRRTVLYPVLFSGGGLEWYDGQRDQSLNNFAVHEDLWQMTWVARRTLELVDFWNGQPADHLLNVEGEVFARAGEWYLVYLPQGDGVLTVPNGRWEAVWYNAATGVMGNRVEHLAGAGTITLDSGESGDWVVVVRRL